MKNISIVLFSIVLLNNVTYGQNVVDRENPAQSLRPMTREEFIDFVYSLPDAERREAIQLIRDKGAQALRVLVIKPEEHYLTDVSSSRHR
jgi:hypothetical protein